MTGDNDGACAACTRGGSRKFKRPGQHTKTWSQKTSPLSLNPSPVLLIETAIMRRLSSVGDQVWTGGRMVRVAPVALNCANRARACD